MGITLVRTAYSPNIKERRDASAAVFDAEGHVIAPVFVGGRVIAFVANTAHHADVGGRVPGSESGDSTSIFQDGLRLPVARIVSRGRIEDGLLRTILLNSRTPQ